MTTPSSILAFLSVAAVAAMGLAAFDAALQPPTLPPDAPPGSTPALASWGGSGTNDHVARSHAPAADQTLAQPTKAASPLHYSMANYNWSLNWTHGNFSCTGSGNLTSGTITCGWSNTTWTCGPLTCTLTGGSFTKTWSPGNVSFNYTASSFECTWSAGSSGGDDDGEDEGEPQSAGRDE
jgi:hypothetical protein